MGIDKASLNWQGRPLLRWLVEVLTPVLSPLLVVARPGQDLPALPSGVEVIHDAIPDQGPLAALCHAWPVALAGHVFVTGCDYPFLTADVPKLLADLIHAHDAAVPRIGGQTQPLLALYRTTVFDTLSEITARGGRSMAALLDALDVRWVEDREWAVLDPGGRVAWNVNTPSEYEQAAHWGLGPRGA